MKNISFAKKVLDDGTVVIDEELIIRTMNNRVQACWLCKNCYFCKADKLVECKLN